MKVNFAPKKATSFLPDQMGTAFPAPAAVGPETPSFISMDPLDQQKDFAARALEAGSSTAPAQGGILEGLARIGQGIVGGTLMGKARDRIDAAKKNNLEALRGSIDSGDYSAMLASDDPIAQKLGVAVLEKTLTKKGGKYANHNGVTVWEPEDGSAPSVISRPDKPIIKDNQISYDGGQTWGEIPGALQAHKNWAGAGRAPKTAKADDSGKMPWERKW